MNIELVDSIIIIIIMTLIQYQHGLTMIVFFLYLLLKCGPLANDSAVFIFAVALFNASTIFFNSSGVFLRKLPLTDGLDSHTNK